MCQSKMFYTLFPWSFLLISKKNIYITVRQCIVYIILSQNTKAVVSHNQVINKSNNFGVFIQTR